MVNASNRSGRFRRVFLRLLAAACVLSFAAIVVAADRGRLPAGIRRLYDWPGGDKVGHVVLLAAVTFAVALAFPGRRVRLGRWSLPLASVAVGIGITIEEASQACFPGRTLSVADLGCSYLGILVGTWAAAALRARAAATRGAAPRAT